MQTAEGFWKASALPALQAFFSQTLPSHLPPEVICTIAALYVLEEFFGDQESEWTLIQKKAKAYLTKMKVAIMKELDNVANFK